MRKTIISQRELRNDSARVLREVQSGETIVVTRNAPRAAHGASTITDSARIWMPSSIRVSMAEATHGLLDTSVVVDHDVVEPGLLPDESAIAAVTLAELAAGPHATEDDLERARRQDRPQWATATWDALPFDAEAARAYGRVFAATRAAGRSSRVRVADLLIAATAVANGLDLHTRHPDDFIGLENILRVVAV